MSALKILNICILGFGLASVIAMVGFALVYSGGINVKNSKKSSALGATLLAACGMWLTGHFSLGPRHEGFDLVITFSVLWFLCLFVFWTGIAMGLGWKLRHKRGHDSDFGHSSMLSMQFIDTHLHESLGKHPPNFQETEILLVKQPAHINPDGSSSPATGEGDIKIPVTRHNG
ncbi:MAG: hypothetical protein WCG50_17715 [Rhodoferax sp.]|uniref:hypothetical protein n=1 Tax=Rhodoferax sp. TaxID=50421 RepID=UPI00301B56D4